MARFVTESFVPARVHVKEQAADFERFGDRFAAQWTPTILLLDPDGEEEHRIEGFLPAEDFLAQLELGVAHAAFKRGDWEEAEGRFRAIVEVHPDSDAAPEAMYWAGVARYKKSGDGRALADTARAFHERYDDTAWAKKASVWG